ncbi:hypothetical protein SDC9_207833 [bioreactor metagenome]|uniref:Uncharacterized protein n=1 Tax=bioreactor metagenome TaxID=1076179 RepID=A0A645J8X5_9ZZZZ
MTTPSFSNPMAISITPAMMVAMASPVIPNCCTIPYTITINAPVGPPICTLLPPKNEMMNPAIIAVYNPCSGETPEAIPNAIARGRATIPTMIPAIRSL